MSGTTLPAMPGLPPGCFSELVSFNQCYNDIAMMRQILKKVICDLSNTDPEFQQCIAGAVASVGAGLPIAGVTNGSLAQPGIVGQFIQFEVGGTTNGSIGQIQVLSVGVLPPGDWNVWAWAYYNTPLGSMNFALSPGIAGFSYPMQAFQIDNPGIADSVVVSPAVQGSFAVPTLLAFSFETNQTSAPVAGGAFTFFVAARRMR